MMRLFNYVTLLCLGFYLPAIAGEIQVTDRIPLYGGSVYKDNFSHFSYVNPDAPKQGRIVMPAYGGFDNFNPFIFKGIASPEHALLSLDTLGIVPLDDNTTVYPLLAKQFELPDDKSFVGFILDEKAVFSDGSPVMADDIIFSYNVLIEKGAPFYRVYYGDVDHVEKVSSRHVRFYLKKGTKNKELPLILAQLKIYSAVDWKNKDFSKPELRVPLGSGPYILEKFSPNKYLVFKRNPDYWAKDIPSRKGFFNFDEVRYDYYQDTTVTLQALFSGNIDVREEYIAKIWVSGYDNDIVKSGRIKQENLKHSQPANLQFFGFNTRLEKFMDRRVRQAIGLTFNFDWANDKLFYNQYQRLFSYFTNTGMEAIGLPTGKELDILKRYKNKLPKSVFTQAPALAEHKNFVQTRANLKKAVKLLNDAGYDFVDGVMTNLKTQEPLQFEILSNSANGSSFTRVMLPFIENLKKIGIKVSFRNLEPNIFKNRLDNFDFEMAILSLGVTNLPGNEQKEMWGSQAADIKGSYNLAGVKNPVIDDLTSLLVAEEKREDYEATVRALDRVLLNEHYIIPQWFAPYKRVAYWNKLKHPETNVKAGFDIFTWWSEQ